MKQTIFAVLFLHSLYCSAQYNIAPNVESQNLNLAKLELDLTNDFERDNIAVSKELALNGEFLSDYQVDEVDQVKSNFFDKLGQIKGVEVVYISKAMLGKMPKMNMPGVNIASLVSKLESIQTFSSEQKSTMKVLKDEVDKHLRNERYETVLSTKDDTSKTSLHLKKYGQNESEMVMIKEDARDTSVIRFLGHFTLEDIQALTKGR
ncbi:MAG: hypothetical protein RL662_1044 [Bacteroidota bacterium]|jgi:hypothetical protein